jgi:hypothetical protein
MFNSNFPISIMPINVETTVNEVCKSLSDLEAREIRILEDFTLFGKTSATLVLWKNVKCKFQGRK